MQDRPTVQELLAAVRGFLEDEVVGALAGRGYALAVASKNDADQALDMMASHPEMILRPEDVVAHRISWNEKSQGIDDMLEELSLGKASATLIRTEQGGTLVATAGLMRSSSFTSRWRRIAAPASRTSP